MQKESNDGYLKHYKNLVEDKLNWGSSEGWRSQDFEALSNKIFESTQVLLSSTTLKRIWGKLKYESVPNAHTMDTLAAFLGYENWLTFKTSVDDASKQQKTVAIALVDSKKWLGWILISAVLTVIIALFLSFALKENKIIYTVEELDKVSFSSTLVAEGLPNTVVFNYDVGQLNVKKAEIQQSWDERLRFEIDPAQKKATATYNYPGYYRAKLLLDEQIAQEHDLYIKSDGWLGVMHQKNEPRYLLPEEFSQQNGLVIEPQVISKIQPKETQPNVIGFHYVDDLGDLQSNHFTFESTFKNTYRNGHNICQLTRIVLLCTEGYFIIPFTIPGCVGNHKLTLNERVIDGKYHDLSAFSYKDEDWQTIRFQAFDKEIKIHLNDKLIFMDSYSENAGRVVGMRFLFSGNGEVKDIRLLDENAKIVFECF